jgi:hypothetical protein
MAPEVRRRPGRKVEAEAKAEAELAGDAVP